MSFGTMPLLSCSLTCSSWQASGFILKIPSACTQNRGQTLFSIKHKGKGSKIAKAARILVDQTQTHVDFVKPQNREAVTTQVCETKEKKHVKSY